MSALAILALVGGTVTSTIFAVDARRQAAAALAAAAEEKKAKEIAVARETETAAVLDFLEHKVFAAARPVGLDGGLGNDVTLRQAIEAALPFVESIFTNQPLIEARLRMTLGASFYYSGDAKPAAEQFELASNLFTHELGADHPDTRASMHNLAECYAALGRYSEAVKLYEEAHAASKANSHLDHPDMLESTYNLAKSYAALGRQADSLKLYEENFTRRKAKHGPEHSATLESMDDLADSYAALRRHADAGKLREETLVLRKAKLGPDHPDTLTNMDKLANSYAALGRHTDVLKLREELLFLRKAKLGPEHPETLGSMHDLAVAQAKTGCVDKACWVLEQIAKRGFYSKALASATKIGPDGINELTKSAAAYRAEQTLQSLDALVLGELRLLAGDPRSAEVAIRSAIKRDSTKGYCYKSLGLCLLAQCKTDESRQAFQEVLKDRKRKDGTYDLEKADPDQLTAAYFLDLITEQAYIERFASDKRLSCFPLFYIAQRREIEGKKDEAIKAYERCVELGKGDNPHTVRALAEWKLRKLKETQ